MSKSYVFVDQDQLLQGVIKVVNNDEKVREYIDIYTDLYIKYNKGADNYEVNLLEYVQSRLSMNGYCTEILDVETVAFDNN